MAVLFSVVVFVLATIFVVGTVALKAPQVLRSRKWLLAGLLVSAFIAGALFPWGTFGFWLAFLSMAITIPISLHGLSKNGWLSCLGAIVGVVAGGVAATLWAIGVTLSSFAGSSPFMFEIMGYGLILYGLTFGLVVFASRPQKRSEAL